jgi:hypothetical protein
MEERETKQIITLLNQSETVMDNGNKVSADQIKEHVVMTSQTVIFLIGELRELAKLSNRTNNRALNVVAGQLLLQACQMKATLVELAG